MPKNLESLSEIIFATDYFYITKILYLLKISDVIGDKRRMGGFDRAGNHRIAYNSLHLGSWQFSQNPADNRQLFTHQVVGG